MKIYILKLKKKSFLKFLFKFEFWILKIWNLKF